MYDAVLEKSRDVVDDRCNGCQRHLQANLAERAQKLCLKWPTYSDVAVQCNEHCDPDCPHLCYVDKWPDIHLHILCHRAVVVVANHW